MSTIKLDIDTSLYRTPTEKEIRDGKNFVLRREKAASELQEQISDILTEAAGQIAAICLKYNIKAEDFTMTANTNMYSEVSDVMDETEEAIMELIEQYSASVTDDKKHRQALILYILSLGRSGMNLRSTLEGYMNRYLYDIEALIASFKLRMEKNPQIKKSAVISQIKAAQHSVYTTPAVREAIASPRQLSARYIKTKGVHRDDVPLPITGSSNSNANNVENMAKITLQMAWMREELDEWEEDGAVGYYQLRGSSYPCEICDAAVGFYLGFPDRLEGDIEHPHCQCWRIPIYRKEEV